MSSSPRRHSPPTYEDDQAADPYVYDDGDELAYDDPKTDEDLAMIQQREADAEVAADVAEFEGDIDAPEEEDGGWLEEGRDEENVRREVIERESGVGREQLDDIHDFEE